MSFPSPPWHLHAEAWVSLFRVSGAGSGGDWPGTGSGSGSGTGTGTEIGRPPGVYGAAFLAYDDQGVLAYRELLVARLLDARRRTLRITDIWVDSATSREGGRSLWAIPKELATLDLDDRRLGPSAHTRVAGRSDHGSGTSGIAAAEFASLPSAAVLRTPYRARASQLREDGTEVVTPLSGSLRAFPALGSWDVPVDGPLGFLHGRRPFLSFRLVDARITFG